MRRSTVTPSASSRSISTRSWASCGKMSAKGNGVNPSPMRSKGSRATRVPWTQKLAPGTLTPPSTSGSAIPSWR